VEKAHFEEDEMRNTVKAAKEKYEDALRAKFFGFQRRSFSDSIFKEPNRHCAEPTARKGETDTPPHSRGAIPPEWMQERWPSKDRGRRECRAPNAPDSRVCNGSGRTHTR